MAHVLLGWELGANRGHLLRIVELAGRLLEAGHRVSAALQTLDGAELLPPAVSVWQGPVWPRLIVSVARPEGPPPATMGDILHRLGLERWETAAGLMRGWDALLAAARPDVLVADFAPFMLLAARGRVPTIAVGTGFERVPPQLARFPSLTGERAVHDEAATVAAVNRGLVAAGAPPLERLPALFAADVSLVGAFAELDPYAGHRSEPLVAPTVGAIDEGAVAAGAEVFVYAFERIGADTALWEGLALSKLPVRVHVPRATAALAARLAGLGLAFEPAPLPMATIAQRSRLALSHGGHGFVSAALLAGLPQVVTWYDVEKRFRAECVTRLGAGGRVGLHAIKAEPFARSLRALYEDDAMAARTRAARPRFWAQMGRSMPEAVLSAVARLAG